jgi:hypothetical protein
MNKRGEREREGEELLDNGNGSRSRRVKNTYATKSSSSNTLFPSSLISSPKSSVSGNISSSKSSYSIFLVAAGGAVIPCVPSSFSS